VPDQVARKPKVADSTVDHRHLFDPAPDDQDRLRPLTKHRNYRNLGALPDAAVDEDEP
jgi:hypothetical protein